jgi:VanZ family protein
VRTDPFTTPLRPWNSREALIAIAIVFLYASSDEIHQIFVPTRTALVSDVLIDTTGAIGGMLLLWALGKKFNWWQIQFSALPPKT